MNCKGMSESTKSHKRWHLEVVCLWLSVSRGIKSNKGMTNICIVRKIKMLVLKHLVLMRLTYVFISDAFLCCIKASGHRLCFLYMKLV